MTNRERIDGSVDIAAPPAAVWTIVSDLKRMGEWSPQCTRMRVLGGEVRLGARTFNLNRQGWLRWPTNAKVVAFEPERKLAFRVLENRTVWTYELEPIATGTRLTESRTAPTGVTSFSNAAVKIGMGGIEAFEARLERGIRQTLDRIKAEAEAA